MTHAYMTRTEIDNVRDGYASDEPFATMFTWNGIFQVWLTDSIETGIRGYIVVNVAADRPSTKDTKYDTWTFTAGHDVKAAWRNALHFIAEESTKP